MLILSGDIINPGPVYNLPLPKLKIKGLHALYLNFNSHLPKIDDFRYIAKVSITTVTEIAELKPVVFLTHKSR